MLHSAQAHVVQALMMHQSLQAMYERITKHVKGTFQALHGEHPKTHRLLFFLCQSMHPTACLTTPQLSVKLIAFVTESIVQIHCDTVTLRFFCAKRHYWCNGPSRYDGAIEGGR